MSFEPRANYWGGLDFTTFRVVLHEERCLFVQSTAPISGSTGETRGNQGLASTLSTRESAKQPGLIGQLLWEYQGKWWKCLVFLFLLVHVIIYHKIFRELFIWKNWESWASYLISEYSHHSACFFSALCNTCRKAHYKRAQSQKPQCESDAVLPTRYLYRVVCFVKHDVQLKNSFILSCVHSKNAILLARNQMSPW